MSMVLDNIMAYKGVYALSTIKAKDGQLAATHYACCLIGGPAPVWGVWNINGRFQRFFGARKEIEEAYPQLVWRRKMANWRLQDVDDLKIPARVRQLETTYGKKIAVVERVTPNKEVV